MSKPREEFLSATKHSKIKKNNVMKNQKSLGENGFVKVVEFIKSVVFFFPFGEKGWKLLCRIYSSVSSVPATCRCVFLKIFYPSKTLFVRGWIIFRNGKVLPNNWGDDINVSFFEEATGKRVVVYPKSWLSRAIGLEHFVLIGSVINSASKSSIVWGSGLINDKLGLKLSGKPKKILAVRGPLTRQWLLAQGIACPEIYGDPALLLPKFYKPKTLELSRVGLIPHHADIERGNENVLRFAAEPGVRTIRVQGYENWRDFIDEICASDFVISASLHGLIVAEAYGVPALWVEFSEHIPGWDFKFHDFYESIGKKNISPIMITEKTRLEDLLEMKKLYTPGTFDGTALLEACPLKLKPVPVQ